MSGECPNPLLLGWLKEWMDEAQGRNSKGFLVYKKAYQSMKACTLTFNHPSEAQQLSGLGPKLCDRLADKLKTHCLQNGLPVPEKTAPNSKRQNSNDEGSQQPNRPPKRLRKAQLYVPKLRSGAYALVMALSELEQEGTNALSKADLIEKAQPLCDASFTAPSDPTKFYTAWKSMQTLESKELVCTKGHPTKKYYLSDDGWEVALRMKATEGGVTVTNMSEGVKHRGQKGLTGSSTVSDLRGQNLLSRRADALDILELSPNTEADIQSYDNRNADRRLPTYNLTQQTTDMNISAHSVFTTPIVVRPGSFEVKLVLDTREIRTKTDRDYISTELKKHDVVPEIRSLPLGDVLWIAKLKPPYDTDFKLQNEGDEEEGNDEIVLEHVVERKRLDDLIGSIKDGRFHEQKFRLKKSGMRHVTYLIEDYSISAEKGERYGEAVDSAIAAMQVVNDIFVKRTSKLDDTIQYLARMTKLLRNSYETKELHIVPSASLDVHTYLSNLTQLREKSPMTPYCITFSAFRAMCDKSDSMTLRDVYLKLLMCTRGVTGDKAIEIQKIWSTPRSLIEAYEKAVSEGKPKETLISDKLADRIPRKKVARALSAKIAEVWAG